MRLCEVLLLSFSAINPCLNVGCLRVNSIELIIVFSYDAETIPNKLGLDLNYQKSQFCVSVLAVYSLLSLVSHIFVASLQANILWNSSVMQS